MIDWQPIETAPKEHGVWFIVGTRNTIRRAMYDAVPLCWIVGGVPIGGDRELARRWTHWAPINLPEDT